MRVGPLGVGVVLAVAPLARAADAQPAASEVGAAVVVAPAPEGQGDEGPPALETSRLPVESRTSVIDTVGRYFPGATLATDGGLRLRGGRAEDVGRFVDGVRTSRLILPLGLVDRVGVQATGYGSALGDVAGGVVDVATRSGSRRLHLGIDLFHELHDRAATVLAPTISGPLVAGELHYTLAVRGELVRQGPEHDPAGTFPDPPQTKARALAGGLKVTWLPQPAQRLDLLLLADGTARDNGGRFDVAPEAQPAYDTRGLLGSVRWTGTFGSGIAVRGHAAYVRDTREELPVLCRSQAESCQRVAPSAQLVPTGSLYSNWVRHASDQSDAWEMALAVEAPVAGTSWLDHRLRASARVRPGRVSADEAIPGNRFVQWSTRSPERQIESFANDPRFEPGQPGGLRGSATVLGSVTSVEDELRLGDRLRLTPGLALVTSRVHARDGLTVNDAAPTPGLSAVWQADGRTWLRASSYRRLGSDAEGLARFVLGAPVTRDCRWNGTGTQFTRDCEYSGGAAGRTVGLPCGPGGVSADGLPCGTAAAAARTWEHTLGASRALGRGWAADLEGTYRRADDVPTVRESNRMGEGSAPTGAGAVFRSGRPQVVLDWSARPGSFHRALAGTVALRRSAGALRALVAYTLSHSQTEAGDDGDDRRHAVRGLVSYDLRGWASLGLAYRYDSGAPLRSTLVAAPTTLAAYRVLALTAADPVADAGAGRGPATHGLNLQLHGNGRPLLGVDLDLYLDVMNVFASRVLAPVASADAPDFGALVASPAARWVRLGAQYRF